MKSLTNVDEILNEKTSKRPMVRLVVLGLIFLPISILLWTIVWIFGKLFFDKEVI